MYSSTNGHQKQATEKNTMSMSQKGNVTFFVYVIQEGPREKATLELTGRIRQDRGWGLGGG